LGLVDPYEDEEFYNPINQFIEPPISNFEDASGLMKCYANIGL